MQAAKHKRLEKPASAIREQFERDAIPLLTLAWLYNSYNPLLEITRFILTARAMFPRLNCGLASPYLRDVLQKGEVVHGTYKGNGHTFLLIDGLHEQWIIDITADQFGGPKVYVGPLKSPWSMPEASQDSSAP